MQFLVRKTYDMTEDSNRGMICALSYCFVRLLIWQVIKPRWALHPIQLASLLAGRKLVGGAIFTGFIST